MAQYGSLQNLSQVETRLQNGADLLFKMEQEGNVGADYERWLASWTRLLSRYEQQMEESEALRAA